MYVPAHFAESRPDVIARLIARHPLATVITTAGRNAYADHLPLLLRPVSGTSGTLVGHIARSNPALERTPSGTDVLAIFQGPDHYVSPSWYASKAEHGQVVPTWNYVVVHARGVLSWRDDVEWLREHLSELTELQESKLGEPWSVDDAPAEFLDRMMRGIVGFEISISEVSGKWKVSQNRDLADRRGVAEGLDRLGTETAAQMSRLIPRQESPGDA